MINIDKLQEIADKHRASVKPVGQANPWDNGYHLGYSHGVEKAIMAIKLDRLDKELHPDVCELTEKVVGYGVHVFYTSCGNHVLDGSFKHCPHCGRPLRIKGE